MSSDSAEQWRLEAIENWRYTAEDSSRNPEVRRRLQKMLDRMRQKKFSTDQQIEAWQREASEILFGADTNPTVAAIFEDMRKGKFGWHGE